MKKRAYWVIALDAAVLLLLLFVKEIAEWMMRCLPACFFKTHFGIDCTTCGATRCVYSLAGFNFASAFGYNPYIFCLSFYLLILLVLLNLMVFGVKFAKKAIRALASWKAFYAWLFLYVVFGLVRIFN